MTPFPLGRPARMAVFASGRGTNLEARLGPEAAGAFLALSPRENPQNGRAPGLERA